MNPLDTPKKETTRLNQEKVILAPPTPPEGAGDYSEAKLLPLIKEANLTKVAITLGNVDPDGMACAMTMEAIIHKLGYHDTSIFYRGPFNRPQNKVFRTLLNINLLSEEKFKAEDKYTCLISVDAPASLCPVTPDFIIDHHEQSGPANIGSDIQMVGASSSIVLGYAQAVGIDFESELGQKLCTALLVGIITDSKNGIVETTCNLDYEAMAFCHLHKDQKLYKEIIAYPRPIYYNDLFCLAWNNKTIEGTLVVSGVGVIPEVRSGILSDIAEKFVEVEGIRTSVIFAIVDDYIDISIRSNSSINVDELIKTAFGGLGGAKPGAGRSRIPLPVIFKNIPDLLSSELYDICVKIIKHKVLQAAGDKK